MFFRFCRYDIFIEIERVIKTDTFTEWIRDTDTIEVWVHNVHIIISKRKHYEETMGNVQGGGGTP